MNGIIEISHHFDGASWQIAAPSTAGPPVLVTWDVGPDPVDGGVPPPVATLLAEALCALGPVLYGGDPGNQAAPEIAIIPLRRGMKRHRLSLFRALRAAELLPAFDSAVHDWAMNAQWLIVADRATAGEIQQNVHEVARILYEEWRLPEGWPAGVSMIVQAAVDGDGAGCYCADPGVEGQFIAALRAAASGQGFEVKLEN